ncbi:hypothetical protein SMICM304S_05542 [Streptomyces microflavus]
MVFMGDRATLLETGRFVQRRGQKADKMADAAFAAVIAGAAGAGASTPGPRDATTAGEAGPAVEAPARGRGRTTSETTATVGHVDADAVHATGATGVTTPDAGTTDAVDAADSAETEARHRRAAEAGDTASMSVLGALLLRRGELDGAETYLRAATADGDLGRRQQPGRPAPPAGLPGRGRRLVAHRRRRRLRRRRARAGPPLPRARGRAGRGVLAAAVRRAGPRAGRLRARRPPGAPRRHRRRALAARRRRAGPPGGRLPAGPHPGTERGRGPARRLRPGPGDRHRPEHARPRLPGDPAAPDARTPSAAGAAGAKGGKSGDSPVAGPATGRVGEALSSGYRRAAARGQAGTQRMTPAARSWTQRGALTTEARAAGTAPPTKDGEAAGRRRPWASCSSDAGDCWRALARCRPAARMPRTRDVQRPPARWRGTCTLARGVSQRTAERWYRAAMDARWRQRRRTTSGCSAPLHDRTPAGRAVLPPTPPAPGTARPPTRSPCSYTEAGRPRPRRQRRPGVLQGSRGRQCRWCRPRPSASCTPGATRPVRRLGRYRRAAAAGHT